MKTQYISHEDLFNPQKNQEFHQSWQNQTMPFAYQEYLKQQKQAHKDKGSNNHSFSNRNEAVGAFLKDNKPIGRIQAADSLELDALMGKKNSSNSFPEDKWWHSEGSVFTPLNDELIQLEREKLPNSRVLASNIPLKKQQASFDSLKNKEWGYFPALPHSAKNPRRLESLERMYGANFANAPQTLLPQAKIASDSQLRKMQILRQRDNTQGYGSNSYSNQINQWFRNQNITPLMISNMDACSDPKNRGLGFCKPWVQAYFGDKGKYLHNENKGQKIEEIKKDLFKLVTSNPKQEKGYPPIARASKTISKPPKPKISVRAPLDMIVPKSKANGGYIRRNSYDNHPMGLGSLYDYINHRYAGGGGVGLGNMGRFFGLYPMRG